MGEYQKYRGNSENKLFYLIDDLYGGVNTEYSDDASQKGEFKDLTNFTVDKRGTLRKRKGFGKLDALSQIFQNFVDEEYIPNISISEDEHSTDYENPVYMKLLRDDNHCFRTLSSFTGERAYRKYQEKYGGLNNTFQLLIITEGFYGVTFWRYTCKLPQLELDPETLTSYTDTETIEMVAEKVFIDGLNFDAKNYLKNITVYENYNKLYIVNNYYCMLVYDNSVESLDDAISYVGRQSILTDPLLTNSAYKPTAAEILTYGVNLLGGTWDNPNPYAWVDTQGITVGSIQGVLFMDAEGDPMPNNANVPQVPASNVFKIGIYYTGEMVTSDPGSTFDISIKQNSVNSGWEDLDPISGVTILYDENNSIENNLAIYYVTLDSALSGYTEISIDKHPEQNFPTYHTYCVVTNEVDVEPLLSVSMQLYNVVNFYSSALYYKDDTLLFSYPEIPTYIPGNSYIKLSLDPTDKIVKIVPFRNVYIIFTKYKIYKLSGTSFNDASIAILNDSLGCCAGETVVPIENVIYFMSDRGLYMLTSNYSYNTSTSALTFENVKELDDKVKHLTSNFVYELTPTGDETISYNNINEDAVALRYNDKYMLFYNRDKEISNDADVLVYDYTLKAFTTFKFKKHPPFLFMVDNRIETCAFIQNIGESTEVVMDYDFTSKTPYLDKSGVTGDLTPIADVYPIGQDEGLILNGEDSYLDMTTLNQTLADVEPIRLDIDLEYTGDSDFTLLDFKNTLTNESQSVTVSSYPLPFLSYSATVSLTITPVPSIDKWRVYLNSLSVSRTDTSTALIDESCTLELGVAEDPTVQIDDVLYTDTYSLNFPEGISADTITWSYFNRPYFDIDGTTEFDEFLGIRLTSTNITTFGGQPVVIPELIKDFDGKTLLTYDSEEDSLTLEISNIDGKLEIKTPNNIGLSGRHKIAFEYSETNGANFYMDYVELTPTLVENTYTFGKMIRNSNYIGASRTLNNYFNGVLHYIRMYGTQEIEQEGEIHILPFTLFNINFLQDNVQQDGRIAGFPLGQIYCTLYDCTWEVLEKGMQFDWGYLLCPSFNISVENGFKIIMSLRCSSVEDLATIFRFSSIDDGYTISSEFYKNLISLSSNGGDKKLKIDSTEIDITEPHIYQYEVLDTGRGYKVTLTVDDEVNTEQFFTYGTIKNCYRNDNQIGDMNFTGVMYSFKMLIPETSFKFYEYDTTETDFDKAISISLETKGYNLGYPQHLKKLKKVFIKAIGGTYYQDLFLEVYRDNFRINTCGVYNTYTDEDNYIVYEFEEIPNYELQPSKSRYDIMEMDNIKLGSQIYQLKKFAIPAKGKNFLLKLYGETADALEIESFGLVCKLGKVKE